jgi:hypothetical protein
LFFVLFLALIFLYKILPALGWPHKGRRHCPGWRPTKWSNRERRRAIAKVTDQPSPGNWPTNIKMWIILKFKLNYFYFWNFEN